MAPYPHLNYYMHFWHALLSLWSIDRVLKGKRTIIYFSSNSKIVLDIQKWYMCLCTCECVYVCVQVVQLKPQITIISRINHKKLLSMSVWDRGVIESMSERHWSYNNQMTPWSEKNIWQEKSWLFLGNLHSVSGPQFPYF